MALLDSLKKKLLKSAALRTIDRNIKTHGTHVYLIGQETTPRFSYTIGHTGGGKPELVLCGALSFTACDVHQILNALSGLIRQGGPDVSDEARVMVPRHGVFTLRRAHHSWSSQLLLGAYDYYKTDTIEAFQVVPCGDKWTIDVPDMSIAYSPATAGAWKWLSESWSLSIPESAHAFTNLDALRGKPITYAARWEDDYWEIFAGHLSDVAEADARVVPIGTLTAHDPSLLAVIDMPLETVMTRLRGAPEWEED